MCAGLDAPGLAAAATAAAAYATGSPTAPVAVVLVPCTNAGALFTEAR